MRENREETVRDLILFVDGDQSIMYKMSMINMFLCIRFIFKFSINNYDFYKFILLHKSGLPF